MSASTSTIPSWSDLEKQSNETPVGKALSAEVLLRQEGKGSAHVQNKLRKFKTADDDDKKEPTITLFRDHAGWCPYCQKTVSVSV